MSTRRELRAAVDAAGALGMVCMFERLSRDMHGNQARDPVRVLVELGLSYVAGAALRELLR